VELNGECSKLIREIEELKNRNEQLKSSLERIKDKENAEVIDHNNEKEKATMLREKFEEEIKNKNNEIAQLKLNIIKNEEEIAKLQEQFKNKHYEDNLEEMCLVFYTIIKIEIKFSIE